MHHACCTEWYNKQGLPDPDSNHAYCWTCIQKNFPERCGGGDGDDGGDGDGGDGIGVGGGIGSGVGGDVADGGGGSAAAAARQAKRGNTSSRYSGAEFEAGRQQNMASAEPLPPGGGEQESSPHLRQRAASSEPRRTSPRAPEGAKRAAVCQMQADLDALSKLPWLGQTARQNKVGQLITAQFEHVIVPAQPRLIDGAVITEYKIKWRTKSEPENMMKTMSAKGFNQSRMGEYIFLHCKYTSDAVKLEIASLMRSKAAKKYVAQVTANQHVAADVAASAADGHRKMFKTDGNARAKQDADNCLITKYIERDAALPDELMQLNMFLMTLFFLMCRISFSVASSPYFRRFLRALRPAFESKLPTANHLRTAMAESHLDEAYERAREITEEVRACAVQSQRAAHCTHGCT